MLYRTLACCGSPLCLALRCNRVVLMWLCRRGSGTFCGRGNGAHSDSVCDPAAGAVQGARAGRPRCSRQHILPAAACAGCSPDTQRGPGALLPARNSLLLTPSQAWSGNSCGVLGTAQLPDMDQRSSFVLPSSLPLCSWLPHIFRQRVDTDTLQGG